MTWSIYRVSHHLLNLGLFDRTRFVELTNKSKLKWSQNHNIKLELSELQTFDKFHCHRKKAVLRTWQGVNICSVLNLLADVFLTIFLGLSPMQKGQQQAQKEAAYIYLILLGSRNIRTRGRRSSAATQWKWKGKEREKTGMNDQGKALSPSD